jgi:hypothetical protein
MINKIANLAKTIEEQTIQRLNQDANGQACEANIRNARTRVKNGRKYSMILIGDSCRFMVEIATGNIYGTKAYGQVHRGHFYGTLDTINDYFWGEYYPTKRDGTLKTQSANGCPVITTAPLPVSFKPVLVDVPITLSNGREVEVTMFEMVTK